MYWLKADDLYIRRLRLIKSKWTPLVWSNKIEDISKHLLFQILTAQFSKKHGKLYLLPYLTAYKNYVFFFSFRRKNIPKVLDAKLGVYEHFYKTAEKNVILKDMLYNTPLLSFALPFRIRVGYQVSSWFKFCFSVMR